MGELSAASVVTLAATTQALAGMRYLSISLGGPLLLLFGVALQRWGWGFGPRRSWA